MTKDEIRNEVYEKLKREPLHKKAFRVAVVLACSPVMLINVMAIAVCYYPNNWMMWAIGLDKETRKKWK
jgi:hypothetical protein